MCLTFLNMCYVPLFFLFPFFSVPLFFPHRKLSVWSRRNALCFSICAFLNMRYVPLFFFQRDIPRNSLVSWPDPHEPHGIHRVTKGLPHGQCRRNSGGIETGQLDRARSSFISRKGRSPSFLRPRIRRATPAIHRPCPARTASSSPGFSPGGTIRGRYIRPGPRAWRLRSLNTTRGGRPELHLAAPAIRIDLTRCVSLSRSRRGFLRASSSTWRCGTPTKRPRPGRLSFAQSQVSRAIKFVDHWLRSINAHSPAVAPGGPARSGQAETSPACQEPASAGRAKKATTATTDCAKPA